ncbi:MAG: helix-turn-helix domain-containing protein [[Clostridium] symbiosum]|uniref:helix-turn-helix domain-containing protein n=1 Tax=Clostridium sp. M62/1 TaxID=411486 RepID=UPI003565830F
MYERGRNQSSCGTSQSSNSDKFKSKRQTFIALKQKGYSNEEIAEYLNCDPSTVRRKLKEWRKEENDEPSGVC